MTTVDDDTVRAFADWLDRAPEAWTCVMCLRVSPPCGWSTVTFGVSGLRCHDCINRYYGHASNDDPAAEDGAR